MTGHQQVALTVMWS